MSSRDDHAGDRQPESSVKAKETFYIDGTKSHYLMNPGTADARILWITTPPMF